MHDAFRKANLIITKISWSPYVILSMSLVWAVRSEFWTKDHITWQGLQNTTQKIAQKRMTKCMDIKEHESTKKNELKIYRNIEYNVMSPSKIVISAKSVLVFFW